MAAGADPDNDQASAKTSIFDPLGLFKSNKPAPPPPKSALDVSKSLQPASNDPKAMAARQEQERANYSRRLEVCLELHKIADATGNEALERKATDLEERAFRIYHQRMLGVPAGLPPQPETAAIPPPEAEKRLTDKPVSKSHDVAPWARASGGASTAHQDRED
jgi:hypothetical protein